jgi:CRP/FNR family transcriptional regulator
MSRQIGEVPTRVFSPGQIIFREGDDPKGEAFIVHIGRVEIRKRIGGEDRLLRVLAKGDLLGELGLFGNTPRSASAVAADAVTLMVIPANRLDHLVRDNPSLAVAIIRDLTTKLLAAENRSRNAEEG